MMKPFFFILSLICFLPPALARGGATTSLVSSMNDQRLLSAQTMIEKILPPVMIKRLQEKAPAQGYRLSLMNSSQHIAGSSDRLGNITINQHLLNDEEKLSKTLIHEWAHQYDFINWQTVEMEKHISMCQAQSSVRGTSEDTTQGACDLFYDIKSSVSTNPLFLEIGGWPLRHTANGYRIKTTNMLARTPDKYEQQSPAEMFAVNLEYFLTDPEYQCRRPSMNKYLMNHFGHQPFQTKNCAPYMKIVDPQFSKVENALVSIDPNRIYQVHYLLAGRGQGISSRFGHSMFRLVICAPGKPLGPDCMKDINHHIVLSFRAFIDTPEINNLKGLRGKYPSTLFFLPFLKVVEEYTKKELRDLESYPLRLSREHIADFAKRAVETHWSYSGKYYFISNNCAVESMNMIRSATFIPHLLSEASVTPYGLRNDLARAGLLDKNLFLDRKAAAEKGLLYISHEENLIKAQTILSEISKGKIYNNYQNWIELDPLERRQIFQEFLPVDKKLRLKYAASALLLEGQAEKVTASSLNGKIYKLLKSNNVPESVSAVLEKIMNLQNGLAAASSELTSPTLISSVGYGLPSIQETTEMKARLHDLNQQQQAQRKEMIVLLESLFPEREKAKTRQTLENKALYMKALSAGSN